MTQEQIWEQAQQVWAIESDSIRRLAEKVDKKSLKAAVELISECKNRKGRVITTGAGTSGVAAQKIAHTLSCIEIPSFFLSPADATHGALGRLQKGDVLIALSKGGGTGEIIRMLPAVKAKGAILIGVTENEDSVLAQASDVVVKVAVEKEADPFNMLATASTIAVIAVFDAIAIALVHQTGYRKEQFAVIHPGGAVGERLVKDNCTTKC